MREQINVKFPDEMNRRIDGFVKSGRYMNRQELIRDAVRRLLETVNFEESEEAALESAEPPETPPEESHPHDLHNCAPCKFASGCPSYSMMPDSRCERFEEKEAAQ